MQFAKLPEAGVPNTGVTSVGLLANTSAPVPVSSVTAEARFADEGVVRNVPTPVPSPDTPLEIGKPVAFVSVPELGVPNAPPLTTTDPAEPTLTPSAVATLVPGVVVARAVRPRLDLAVATLLKLPKLSVFVNAPDNVEAALDALVAALVAEVLAADAEPEAAVALDAALVALVAALVAEVLAAVALLAALVAEVPAAVALLDALVA